jgi:pimeloyl-ACP methyl ester carboxylesterase
MSEAIHYDRRRFIGAAAMAIAGAGLIASRLREPAPGSRDVSSLIGTTSGTDGSPGPITPVDAGALDLGYSEAGPSNGPAAILLYGGAGGITSCVDVAPLASRGYRVIVPNVRNVDAVRPGSSVTTRHGQQNATPADLTALMAALSIEKALVGGFGESARTAEEMTVLWPQRFKGIVPVDRSGVVTLAADQRPLPPKQELAWWYQYYFVRDGLRRQKGEA